MKTDPATPDFTACPYWGRGGRYVVDPLTGQRVPAPDPDAPAAAAPAAEPAPEQPAKKGK